MSVRTYSNSHTQTYTLSLSDAYTHTHSHTRTLARYLLISCTHTHIHTISISFTQEPPPRPLHTYTHAAPWCGHCMSLKPEYKALANHFKNVSNSFLLHRIAPHCISMYFSMLLLEQTILLLFFLLCICFVLWITLHLAPVILPITMRNRDAKKLRVRSYSVNRNVNFSNLIK